MNGAERKVCPFPLWKCLTPNRIDFIVHVRQEHSKYICPICFMVSEEFVINHMYDRRENLVTHIREQHSSTIDRQYLSKMLQKRQL